jgi:cell surface protein SprA
VFLSVSSVVALLLIFPKPLTGSNLPRFGDSYHSLLELFDDSTGTQGEGRRGGPPPRERAEPKPSATGDEEAPALVPKSLTDSTSHQKSLDSAYVVYLDSTARMEQFGYVRRDEPQVQVFARRSHPLFAVNRAAGYKRDVKLDSSGTNILFREIVAGQDVKIPTQLSLREYADRRMRYEFRKMMAEEAHKSKALAGKKDIGELMSSITKIQIPIPSNPILSIFGKPEINLNISGAVDIKAGFRNTKSDQTQISALDQSRNEPDFNQEVQVNVNGTVGDKLNILADWNTQRTFEYENQLKIKYTGYEDEIVQSIEAGNVSLQTPSSYVGSSQALFGVKARFQTGPLTLTTLASQKKGQIKEVAVSGGAQEVPFEIRAWNYSTNHFFVDTLPYRAFYEPYYKTEPITITSEMQNAQIIEEEVWVQLIGTDPTQIANARQGVALISLSERGAGYDSTLRTSAERGGAVEAGRFVRLDRSQYEMEGEGYLGVISLPTSVQDQQIVAIAYRRSDGRQFGEFSRDLVDTSGNKPLILKMVRPKNLISNGTNYPLAWSMMLKNIYSLTGIGRNVKKEGFTLDIYRQVPGQEQQNSILNERLLRVFGFDKYNSDDTPAPNGDGLFDFRPNRTVNQARAEIIFPYLRPFDTGMKSYFREQHTPPITLEDTSEYVFKQIYDTTRTFAQQSPRDLYVIRGKATGEASSKFNLGFNVVEGSVQVLLDGRQLTPNIDFTVDYIVGEVVIRNASALVPGANLQIKYEQNDLFQLASKTLLAARGDLALSQSTNLGFTVMNLNQQTLSDKVRLGEEPSRNTIFGLDGATTIDLPFLTKGLDALPLLQTRELSNLKISGEGAYMLPDPNTKKSTIASDAGESIAYIDDFEGAKRTIPLGITYNIWTQASPPKDSVANGALGVEDTTKMLSKGKIIWYNVLPTDVHLREVYPKKEPGNAANDQITVLDLKYSPLDRGQFNYSTDLSSTLTRQKNWGGVMKPISVTATNLINENINYIELWMKVDAKPESKMIIDMGALSERVIPNGRNSGSSSPNSEDLVHSSSPNGTLQEGEDVGLDMLSNAEEIARYPTLGSDPSGDDYAYDNQTRDYNHINGTENSKNGPGGLIPDTEDLNSNGIADKTNAYMEYELSLDTLKANNPRIVGGGENQWFQFRIPIREYTRLVGMSAPNFENVEYMRIYFLNATDTIHVRIADFSLVGNQWQELNKGDTTFAVSVVSVEENPLGYTSPPGVVRERDKTRPNENVQANEQSLALQLKGIPEGESRQAVKYYTLRPLDLFSYKSMKMFVHPSDAIEYIDENNYDAEVFFRFGLDSLNFYEYRAPLRQDPGNDNWSEIAINFADLTVIKQGRDSINIISRPRPVPGGALGAVYRVLGNPSLTQVRYFSVGVTNHRDNLHHGEALHGQVWVNELRLTSVDDTPGWAYRFDTQLKLADLGAVSFNYSKQDPNFHRLEERFGSRQTGTNWGVNATLQLEKFFPNDWVGTSFPVSYSHTINKVSPKYLPNSDVLVSEAAGLASAKVLQTPGATQAAADAEAQRVILEAETYRVTDTYAAPTFHIGFPSQEWYIRDTFNKLTFGFTYTRSRERNPAVASHLSWSWNARISYAIQFSPDYYFAPFKSLFKGLWFLDEYKDFKIYFAPSSFNWSFGATRARDNSVQRVFNSQEIVSRNFTASRQVGFAWKLTEGGLTNLSGTYNLDIASSLLDFETDRFKNQRPFSRILDDIFFSDKFINLGQDTRYTQQNQFSSRPNIPNILNIKKYLDLTLTYGVDYNWQNILTGGDLGKSAGFGNRISATTNLRLKALFDPLFEDHATPSTPAPRGRRRGGEEEGEAHDTTKSADTTDTAGPKGLGKTFGQLKDLAKIFIKAPLLDYDNITVTFSQDNTAQNSGVVGRPGFVNFWGRVPFFQDSDPRYGPSRLYQLGLISDPSGRLTNFGPRSRFPFFGWDVEPGIRAANGVLSNTYRQTNKLTFKTTRGLWEGAKLDLNWNIGWAYSRTQNVTTDSLGIPKVTNSTTSGNIDRSFLTFPDVLFLGMFKSSLKEVSKKYAQLKTVRDSSMSEEAKITKAFEEGFEALPFLRKLFGQYYPRVNWSLRWDGLERLPIFSGFVSRLSLDHTYSSNFTRAFRNLPGEGGERTDNQRVVYGFAPLVGLNFTFKELLKGNFGTNVRYGTTTSYDLSTASRNIVETLSREVSITASYTRRGFEIPLFGLSLNNDVDISGSYAVTKNSRRTYDVTKLDVNLQGTPLDGSTRTVIEPRIKYVLSMRVTASIYYRYTKVAPDDAGSRIPGSTTNEAGLDIHIAIQ